MKLQTGVAEFPSGFDPGGASPEQGLAFYGDVSEIETKIVVKEHFRRQQGWKEVTGRAIPFDTLKADKIKADVIHVYPDGAQMTLAKDQVFEETGSDTRVFRSEIEIEGGETATSPPAEAVINSIAFSASPSAIEADSIHYCTYSDNPIDNGYVFTEKAGEENSQNFYMQRQPHGTWLRIIVTDFNGLTGDVDSFHATTQIQEGEVFQTVFDGTYVESGEETGVFHASLIRAGWEEPVVVSQPLYRWSVTVSQVEQPQSSYYAPSSVRIRGLKENVADEYEVKLGDIRLSLSPATPYDGCLYLKGGSLYHLAWKTEDGKIFVYVWDSDTPEAPGEWVLAGDSEGEIDTFDLLKKHEALPIATGQISAGVINIRCDINDDGTIDVEDDSYAHDESSEYGWMLKYYEYIRLSGLPGAADEIQEAQVLLPTKLSKGTVWFEYDETTLQLFSDADATQLIRSKERKWDLKSTEDMVPSTVYVKAIKECIAKTDLTIRYQYDRMHLPIFDFIRFQVWDKLGHPLYYIGLMDSNLERERIVFTDMIDGVERGGGAVEGLYHFVVVPANLFDLHIVDAIDKGLHGIEAVVESTDYADSWIIVNGNFFDVSTKTVLGIFTSDLFTGKTEGMLISSYTKTGNSGPTGPSLWEKGWIGQQDDGSIVSGNGEPKAPTAPYKSTDLKEAMGGLVRILPEFIESKKPYTVESTFDDPSRHLSWSGTNVAFIGLDTKIGALFVLVTVADKLGPAIDHAKTIRLLKKSFPNVVVMGCDGGNSVCLAHVNPDSGKLEIKERGGRHFPVVRDKEPVASYISIKPKPKK